jgi:hypothetical protein
MAFDASFRTTFDKGDDVLRSYRTMVRSRATEPSIDVSVWLKAIALIVSVDVGHESVWLGADDPRERS